MAISPQRKTIRAILAATLLTCLISAPSAVKHLTRKINETRFMNYLHQNPLSETIPANLTGAVCWQESRFDPDAERPEPDKKDASYGLMQILTKTARELDKKYPNLPSLDRNLDGIITDKEVKDSLKNPFLNLRYGVRILEEGQERYGALDLSVAAYNAGPETPGNAAVQYQFNKVRETNLGCDGILGTESKKVIRPFQRDYGLDVDSIAGEETKSTLKKLYQSKFKRDPPKGLIPRNRNDATKKHVDKVMGRYKHYNRKYKQRSRN